MKKVMIACLCVLMVLLANIGAAEPIKLKFATMDPAQTPPVVKAYKPWLDRISKASNGTIEIEVYPGGSLGRNPTVQLKLVKDGVADLAFVVPAYTQGRFPDDEVFNLPFMATDGMEAALASHRMYKKGLLGGYDDVIVLAHYTTEMYYLHSTIPIRLPSDLKGRKFRAVNKFQSDVLKKCEAIGIGMPSPKVAENMSRGVIQGAWLDNSAIFTFRVADVAKHHFLLPFGNASLAVVMNKKKFESLPPEAKAAINKHGGDIVEMWMKVIQGHVNSGMGKLKADPEHKIITPTSDEVKAWKEVVQPLIDEWKSNYPRGEMLIKAYQEELDRIRSGK
jgi:TRAP-type C4-dicarboxylate transport system substrate-binding protein